jgi:hypothetical protein
MFINIGCSTNSWKSQQYTFTGTGEYWDVEASVTENTSSTYRIAFSLNYLQDMSNLREGQAFAIKYFWLPEDVVAITDEVGNVVDVILPEKIKELSETKPVGILFVQEQINVLTKTQLERNEFFYSFDHTIDENIAEISKMAETLNITIEWEDQQEDIVLVNTGDM